MGDGGGGGVEGQDGGGVEDEGEAGGDDEVDHAGKKKVGIAVTVTEYYAYRSYVAIKFIVSKHFFNDQ